jgi:predicted Zn-dependent protease
MSTPDGPRSELARAAELLRNRDLAGAEAACREALRAAPQSPAALHLLALIRMEAGDEPETERLMRESIAAAPTQPEFRNNLGALLRRQGRLNEAISAYREALIANPGHRLAQIGLGHALNDAGDHAAAEARAREIVATEAQNAAAWLLLAAALRQQHRYPEAERAAREAIVLKPAEPAAHHELSAILAAMDRAEEALRVLAQAEGFGLRGFDLALTRGLALLQLYRAQEAEACFQQAVELQPLNAEAHLRLATLRFMRGDPDFARDLRGVAARGAGDANLQMLLGKVLRRAGDSPGAEALLREVSARVGAPPEVRIALAEALLDQGKLKEAEYEAAEAAAGRSLDPRLLDVLVTILLCRGRPKDALPFIRAERARRPDSQLWIAHEATAARALGDPLHHRLHDYDRLVQSYDLESPPGWTSMAELNAAALAALESRLRFAQHPLDQNLRNGARTVRDLQRESDAALRALMESFELALAEYLRSAGSDPTHPFTACNAGAARISSAWCMQLRSGGVWLNHVQPHGWISAVYYLAAPPETEDESLKAGWLKFGEPRYATPGASADGGVQPRAGRLVLFPSYMWRGTNPLRGRAPLTAVAFEAAPA